jgi:predicted lipid-binding transport protein (Tim44 family)
MSAYPNSLPAEAGRPILVMALDRRMARAVVATLAIGGYMAFGFAFRLGAEAYLLLGIPITIGFQILVVRRPLRSLLLQQFADAQNEAARGCHLKARTGLRHRRGAS